VKENIKMEKEKEKEFFIIMKAINLKENGKMIKKKEMELFIIEMGTDK
jgi:hypothetical protein